MKKEAPQGTIQSRQLIEMAKPLDSRERAFLYGLWLTGVRTNELCRMKREDVFYDNDGLLSYRVHLSKLKVPEDNIAPFVLLNEDDREIFDEFMSWVNSKESGPLFDYHGCYKKNDYTRKKTGERVERKVWFFWEPYYRIVVKGKISTVLDGANGKIERSVPLHYLRAFFITSSLLASPGDPLLTTRRVGHKKPETTFRYWIKSGAELKSKLQKLEESGGISLIRKD